LLQQVAAALGIPVTPASGQSTSTDRTGERPLSKGKMHWYMFYDKKNRRAVVQINFSPKAPYLGKTITFLQTVQDSSLGPNESIPRTKIDILTFGKTPDDKTDQFVPFYGARWDNDNRSWVPEGAPDPYKNQPGGTTAHPIAYLYDEPVVYSEQTKMFETVVVVPETTEILGSIAWGVKGVDDDVQVLWPDPENVTDRPSAAFLVALDHFYAKPQTVGPDFWREERYDAILDGFPANNAILTADQKKQLDPIVEKIGKMKDPTVFVSVGGFADGSETDPNGTSEARARAVESYLVTKGVPKANVKIAGFFGSAWARYPPSATETRNRRVQVRVHYDSSPSP
jgi:outer membrane protein OmpA-like peptidoglycan-associated protein